MASRKEKKALKLLKSRGYTNPIKISEVLDKIAHNIKGISSHGKLSDAGIDMQIKIVKENYINEQRKYFKG